MPQKEHRHALEEISFLSYVFFKPDIRMCLMLEICHLSCRRLLPSQYMEGVLCSACCVLLLVLLFCTVAQVSDHGLAQICSSEAAVLLELLLPGSCCGAVTENCASRDLPCMFLKGKFIKTSKCINTVFNDQDLSCLSCIKPCACSS